MTLTIVPTDVPSQAEQRKRFLMLATAFLLTCDEIEKSAPAQLEPTPWLLAMKEAQAAVRGSIHKVNPTLARLESAIARNGGFK